MSDQVKKWEEALKEKTAYKAQLETALNQTTAEIFQLQGGLQFAKESLAVEPEKQVVSLQGGEEVELPES